MDQSNDISRNISMLALRMDELIPGFSSMSEEAKERSDKVGERLIKDLPDAVIMEFCILMDAYIPQMLEWLHTHYPQEELRQDFGELCRLYPDWSVRRMLFMLGRSRWLRLYRPGYRQVAEQEISKLHSHAGQVGERDDSDPDGRQGKTPCTQDDSLGADRTDARLEGPRTETEPTRPPADAAMAMYRQLNEDTERCYSETPNDHTRFYFSGSYDAIGFIDGHVDLHQNGRVVVHVDPGWSVPVEKRGQVRMLIEHYNLNLLIKGLRLSDDGHVFFRTEELDVNDPRFSLSDIIGYAQNIIGSYAGAFALLDLGVETDRLAEYSMIELQGRGSVRQGAVNRQDASALGAGEGSNAKRGILFDEKYGLALGNLLGVGQIKPFRPDGEYISFARIIRHGRVCGVTSTEVRRPYFTVTPNYCLPPSARAPEAWKCFTRGLDDELADSLRLDQTYGGVSLSYDGTQLTMANDLAEAIHRYVELCSSIYPKVLDHIANSCDTYWRCAS